MAGKIAHLRIFADDEGKMNRSVLDVGGEVLLVSNFTVAGDARKGRRPSFDRAMRPPEAEAAFEALADALRELGVRVQTGVFGAHMHVSLVNDGPVTIWLDSRVSGD
jgi:D-tyrosyl-tRNA(Tyr) deacylase